MGLPLVATNDRHYLHREDAKAHEVLLCIQTGKVLADENRWRFDTDELYVKTPEEMAASFGADSEPLRNSVEIARRVDFEFEFGNFHFPRFETPADESLEAVVQRLAREGLTARWPRFAGGMATSTRRRTTSASTESSPPSARWAFRLHADRRRLHRLCAQARNPGRTGPRLGGGAVPTHSRDHRCSIRSSTSCCSSDGSTRAANRCPISTFISV